MEENREQPIIMPATALNAAEENSAMSEIGSQNGELGKFKNSKALLDAYNNLQSEFTKKCQMLSQLQKANAPSSSSISFRDFASVCIHLSNFSFSL